MGYFMCTHKITLIGTCTGGIVTVLVCVYVPNVHAAKSVHVQLYGHANCFYTFNFNTDFSKAASVYNITLSLIFGFRLLQSTCDACTFTCMEYKRHMGVHSTHSYNNISVSPRVDH